MRDVGGLSAHIASGLTTLATCWRVTRRDGAVYGFTTLDRDLVIDGVTYAASSGMDRTAIGANIGTAVDSAEIAGLLDSDAIDADSVRNGVWDFARVLVFVVNHADLGMGRIVLRAGVLGEVTTDDAGRFRAEIRSVSQALTARTGEQYSPECRAQLGDARCGVNLATFEISSNALAGSTRSAINATIAQPAGYYNGGVLTMTGGANNGARREVLAWNGSTLTLFQPLPFAVATGDAFAVVPGCDRRLTTCRTRYNNVINFRGEPHIVGNDSLFDAS